MKWTISPAPAPSAPALQPAFRTTGYARRGFTLIELLVVVAILSIVMAMVGYVMVKSMELKSVSENRLDDLIGGLAAARLLDQDLRSLPVYSDPTVPAPPPSFPYVTYHLDSVTLDGKANQPVLYLRSAADHFDRHNGDAEYVRWYVKHGILCREKLNLKTGVWLDLDTATDLDLEPFEVLRGVSWTLTLDAGDPTRLTLDALIYPSMASHNRIEVSGEPPDALAENEKPRGMHTQFQISQSARSDLQVRQLGLP